MKRERKGRAGDWENRRPVVAKGLDWWEANRRMVDLVGTARLGLRVTGKGDDERRLEAAKGLR